MTKFDWIMAGITGLILVVVLEVSLTDSARYVKYDCRLVNTSPDMPEDVKRMCRSRR